MADRERSFLGIGWSFPPTFSRLTASVVMVRDEENVRQSILAVLSTSPGERPLLPDFGCPLGRMVFRNIDTALMAEMEDAVRTALLNWEPRIDVDEVLVEPEPSVPGLVVITVYYTIRKTNTRDNVVYPFYLQEGTLVPHFS